MQYSINTLFTAKEEALLKSLIGQKIIKLRHDAFINRNVSFRKVSFFTNDGAFVLFNRTKAMTFLWDSSEYGSEDVAVFNFSKCSEEETLEKYGFGDNLQIIDVPIDKKLEDITIIEDRIDVFDSKTNKHIGEYEHVKGLIFSFEGFKYCFYRSDWFIEHITIVRGEHPELKIGNIEDDWEWEESIYSKNQRFFRHIKP